MSMTLDEVMQELAALGNDATKKTLLRHGAPEPLFGVRIGDLKPLQKKLKNCQSLALELFATRNSDAMYLAGLIADGAKMTPDQLNRWAANASWHMIAGATVASVAAEHPHAFEIANKWIQSPQELTATAGWSTLSALVATRSDSALPLEQIGGLLDRVAKSVQSAPNRVRYAMNSFIISCGTYVAELGDKAITVARSIGEIDVDMGETDCQVPNAESYILKSRRGAPVAPKRKSSRS